MGRKGCRSGAGNVAADGAVVVESNLAGTDQPFSQALACAQQARLGRNQGQAPCGRELPLRLAAEVAGPQHIGVIFRQFAQHPVDTFGEGIDRCMPLRPWLGLVGQVVGQGLGGVRRPQPVDQCVARDLEQPCPRVAQVAEFPSLGQRLDEHVLQNVIGCRDIRQPNKPSSSVRATSLTIGAAIRKENVTPSGTPAWTKPMNSGTAEHEQNGVTMPSEAASALLAPLLRRASSARVRSGVK